eukprot:TRINITY_DN8018_c0_g1_i1.p1 TRINITY_DN8018_c0_g1~~TRINITY_DN8018_c0_g1_i1.p1  ORF type:complete len:461 (+),score=45.57 TRINITY_DN8018_c0_g1_i1:203-1585(+)
MWALEPRSVTRHCRAHVSLLGLALLVLLVPLHDAQAFTLLSPEEKRISSPPFLWYKSVQIPVEGQIIPFRWENPSAVSGHIAYSRAALNVSEHLLYLQSLNATAAILYDNVSDYPGSYDLESVNKQSVALLHFHCVQIGVIDRDIVSNLLYRNGANMSHPNNVTVRLDGDPTLSDNYWTIVRTNAVWYFVQALLCGLSAACAAVALYKLLAFLRKDGRPRLSVAQMALAIEYIQNMIRLFFWAIDPIWLLRGGFSWQVTNVFVTVHHPLFISSTLLLALYWHQLLKFDRVKISVGLNKMRIPFGVTSLVLVALEILTIGFRIGGFDVGTLTTVSGALIAIVAFVTSVYFVVIGVKVLGQLKQQLSHQSESKGESSAVHRALIQRTTILIVSSAALHLLFVLIVILTTFRRIFWHPVGFYSLLSIKDLLLICISLCQILTFRAPGSVGFQSSKGGSGTSHS